MWITYLQMHLRLTLNIDHARCLAAGVHYLIHGFCCVWYASDSSFVTVVFWFSISIEGVVL